MSKGSGGTRAGGASGNSRQDLAGKASTQLMNAIQSGKFDKMSYQEQDRLLAAADKEASRLKEDRYSYSDSEWEAMGAYQGSGYEQMNDFASGKTQGDPITRKLVSDMDKAIARHKLTKDIVVWRGSDKVETKSGRFVSTSLKASVAEKFHTDKNLHAYLIPKGTPYLYTERKNEAEVILPRNFDINKYKIK